MSKFSKELAREKNMSTDDSQGRESSPIKLREEEKKGVNTYTEMQLSVIKNGVNNSILYKGDALYLAENGKKTISHSAKKALEKKSISTTLISEICDSLCSIMPGTDSLNMDKDTLVIFMYLTILRGEPLKNKMLTEVTTLLLGCLWDIQLNTPELKGEVSRTITLINDGILGRS